MRRLAIAILLTIFASPASSATLRVERDGSAPYTTIQPAIDAAAPGDTILIGPGHYTEHQTATLHLWSWSIEVYALVRTDSLTIMGTDRDEVVIGPETAPEFYLFGPAGIVFDNVVGGDVSSLGSINTYCGINLSTRSTRSTVVGALIRGCGLGISSSCGGPVQVSDCVFENCTEIGVVCWDPTPRFELSRSVFQNNTYAVDVVATPSALVQNCVVTGGSVGIQFETGTAGSIVDCRVTDARNYGLITADGATMGLTRVSVSGGSCNLGLLNGRATGSNCAFGGGTNAAVYIPSWPLLTLHNCHILSAGGMLVKLLKANELPVIHADLRDNYWGIASRDSIAALIWDGTDDPTINGIVDFEPFSATPLPTEKKPLGGVKGLYR